MKFKDLKLIAPVLKAIEDVGYEEPTKIQAEAIPKILNRKDVLGIAQTGTGKTAAFAIPIIQMIHEIDGSGQSTPSLRALILTPTRELAIQIDENISEYNKYTKVRHAVIFGGVKQHTQVQALEQGVQILVATPGRLLDLIQQGYVTLEDLKIFVLDEADRMLDMGFIHDIKKLVALLPAQRQTLFFSATMPNHILSLSEQMLTDPERVEVARKSSVAKAIQQFVYYTNKEEKVNLLNHILVDKKQEQVLVFVRTKHGADKLAKKLKKMNLQADAIHGNKSQNARQRTLKNFKEDNLKILIATDIAARGIDITKLPYVINYDVPNIPETYVHRIGRSGRAGEKGVAISISEPEENAYVVAIEDLTKKPLIKVKDHPYPQTDRPMTAKEKKEHNKEKQERKLELIKARRKSKQR